MCLLMFNVPSLTFASLQEHCPWKQPFQWAHSPPATLALWERFPALHIFSLEVLWMQASHTCWVWENPWLLRTITSLCAKANRPTCVWGRGWPSATSTHTSTAGWQNGEQFKRACAWLSHLVGYWQDPESGLLTSLMQSINKQFVNDLTSEWSEWEDILDKTLSYNHLHVHIMLSSIHLVICTTTKGHQLTGLPG